MIHRRFFLFLMILVNAVFGFAQAGALRDYVGLISIHYHPDVVEYMGRFKEAFEKRGYSDAAKSIDNYLKGLSGSGFAYVAEDGTCYILTNEHVIAQSESLSITFEKLDGAKTTYDRLKVLFADEEKDLALLVFDAGIKPFSEGLSFMDGQVDDGDDVFAAGFPGLGNTAVWQFSRGTVSNAAARIPKDAFSDETRGPYIQHTAQVDPGNSGGPLLEAVSGVPAGYAVVGINTLSAFRRQAANYAIPADQVGAFIDTALSAQPQNERELLAKKADEFIKGLSASGSVYPHIAKFLTGACTASNAEYAITELLEKSTRRELEDIDNIFIENPVKGMNSAVAWLIESSMRSRSGTIKVSLDSISANDKGTFDVTFLVNDKPVKSEWVKEYGIFRMDTYGDVVTGDKALLAEKQRQNAMRTDFGLSVSGGYAYNLEYGSAFFAALKLSSFDIGVFYGQEGYWQVGMYFGFEVPIRLGSFAIIPFGKLGMDVIGTDASKAAVEAGAFGFGFAFDISVRGGLMFTTAAVPGLFGQVFYQYNLVLGDIIPNHGLIGVGIGYGF